MSWGVETQITFLEVRLRASKVRELNSASTDDQLHGAVVYTFARVPGLLQMAPRSFNLLGVAAVEVLLSEPVAWRLVSLGTAA